MIREELARLTRWEERHERLIARLGLAVALTLVVDVAGASATWWFERGAGGGDIDGFGDAIFFSTVQLLTVSSQIKNPLTPWGRVVDVGLEMWAIFVVSAIAGSFAAFFSSSDPGDRTSDG